MPVNVSGYVYPAFVATNALGNASGYPIGTFSKGPVVTSLQVV